MFRCLFKEKSKVSYINGRKITGDGIWKLSFGDQTAIKLFNWTHYDGHELSMPRKFNKIKEAREIFANRPGQGWNKKS